MAIKFPVKAGKLPIDSTAVAPPAKATEPVSRDATVLPMSGYLTAEWVKRHYSISNSTLYKWVAESRKGGGNGFPAPVKIGPRAVRWSAASLHAFEVKLMGNGQ